ncbi:MAG TPA: polysaccharide biosynthesis/export family protein [Chthoniobacteraceae bacterium]|nr:polysaccharide biosynthesis/export family protein [Chthoniobacteraceae bacterium]
MRPGVGGVLQGSNIFVPAERMESVDPDAKLAPGDELTVEIEQDREGGFQKIVSATGEIRMDPGGAVKVAGKTTGEAAADIKRMLEKDYYYTATVKISLDRRSRQMVKAGSISLGGDVKTVGQLDLEAGQRLTVSEAILKAGGFTPFADSRHIQVTRTEGGGTKSFTLDVKQIIEKGRVDLDVPVVDGDRIFVPKARIVF